MSVEVHFAFSYMMRNRPPPDEDIINWDLYLIGIHNTNISQFISKVVFTTKGELPKICENFPYFVNGATKRNINVTVRIILKHSAIFGIFHEVNLNITESSSHAFEFVYVQVQNPTPQCRKLLLDNGGIFIDINNNRDKRITTSPMEELHLFLRMNRDNCFQRFNDLKNHNDMSSIKWNSQLFHTKNLPLSNKRFFEDIDD